MFGMVTGYRLQLGLRGIIYFAPRVTGHKVTRGVAGINYLIAGFANCGYKLSFQKGFPFKTKSCNHNQQRGAAAW